MDTCCEFIYVKKNGIDGTSYPLACGTQMILGSDKNCDFRIQLPSVAEKQIKIDIDNNGKVFISNIGDSNSMQLNGMPLTNSSFVPHNSIISIGSFKFRFHYSADLADQMHIDQQSPSTCKSPNRQNKENLDSNVPVTPPNSESKKKQKLSSEKVHTPIPPKKSRRSSGAHVSSLSTSLMSIPESAEPTPSPQVPRSRVIVSDIMDVGDNRVLRRSTRKSVSFGPVLSPEFFDRRMPPNTPVKRGSLPFGISCLQSVTETQHEFDSDDECVLDIPEESNYETIVQDLPAISLPTPLKNDIKALPQLKKTKRSLHTPLKVAIKSKPALRSTRRSLSMPNSQAHPGLTKTKKSLPTPVRAEIQRQPRLRKTKRSLPTPLKREIKSKLSLRKTLKSLPTPVKAEIISKQSLRKTKQSLPTPLKKEIKSKIALKKTMKSLPTPLRTEIKEKPALRKTKRTMSTPLRNEIKSKPSLRKTMKSLPTPLRTDIKKKPALRKTKYTMPTPLRNEIKSKPSLRKTLKSLPTPLKKQIKSQLSLRKTKQTLPTPVRNEIKSKPSLRKTKMSLPTPVKDAILSKPSLRKSKRSLPTPIRRALTSNPQLRKTKKSFPTPLRKEIEGNPKLRVTKRSLPSPLKAAIQAKHVLKTTKRALPSDLRDEIKIGYELQKTKLSLATPLREEIKSRPSLRQTKRLLPTPLRKEIQSCPILEKTKHSLATPVRREIESCPSLRSLKKSLPTPLKNDIRSKPILKSIPKKKESRKRNRSVCPSSPFVTTEPARKRQRVNPATPVTATVVQRNIIENIPSFSPTLDTTALINMFSTSNNTSTNATDPIDYFEPFLFEAQEVINTGAKQKRSYSTRKKVPNTISAAVRRSSRLRQPTDTTSTTSMATTKVPSVTVKESKRNNRVKSNESNVAESKSPVMTTEVPNEILNNSDVVVNSKHDDSAKSVPVERAVRNTRSRKRVATNMEEPEVLAPITKSRRTTRSKGVATSKPVTIEQLPVTMVHSSSIETIKPEEVSSPPRKRKTRSKKKSSDTTPESEKAKQDQPTIEQVKKESLDTVKTTHSKTRQTKKKKMSCVSSEEKLETPRRTKRITRSLKSDSSKAMSCDVSTSVKTTEKKSSKKERHVQFANATEVNLITPMAVRRSARLK